MTDFTIGRRATTVPLHLTVDPWWDLVSAIAFGRVDDGLPDEQVVPLAEDPRITFVLDGPGKDPVIGFVARRPGEIDVPALRSRALWRGPRFDVPALALAGAAAGEILLAIGARFAAGEATAGAAHFHRAIGTPAGDGPVTGHESAIERWRLALEAGEAKALFGLGYTLVEAGRPREAYHALRRYTELTPRNAWAWRWLGRACGDLGELGEARAALARALECEARGSFETDARELLDELRS